MEQTEKSSRGFSVLVKAELASYAITAILLLLLAFLLYKLDFGEKQISIGLTVTYILSCFAGGFLTGRQMKTRRFLWGAASGAVYFLLLIGVSALAKRGITADIGHIASSALLCLGGGTLGGMFS